MSDQDRLNILYPDEELAKPNVSIAEESTEVLPDEETLPNVPISSEESTPEEPYIQGKNPYVIDDSLESKLYADEEKIVIDPDMGLDDMVDVSEGESVETLRTNLGFIAAGTGASNEDVAEIVAQARLFDQSTSNPQQTMAELRNEYGAGFDSKLNDAITLVNSYPPLGAWLDKTKNGNNPAVIRKIIKIAANKKAQGRLDSIYRMMGNRK